MSSVSSVTSILASAATPPTVNISSILAAAAGTTTPGIDVNAAVTAALYADRAQERSWQAQQASLNAQTTALTAIQTATTTVTTDMQALNSLTGPLSARAVASSNTSAVQATAASGTTPGNHIVVVNSLASTGSWYSDLETTATAAVPAETFTISTTAGGSATITTGAGVNSLADIANSINVTNKSLGLTATVINDSSGSRLAIVSNASGSAGDFTVTSAPTTTTSWTSPSIPSGSTLGANSFTIDQGSGPVTITSTAGETFAQLATDINTRVPGVTAGAVSDSQGTHLVINSGSNPAAFTISEPGAEVMGFSQASAGANASLTVDGIPISSASNKVTGAIGGVTLNLLNTTAGSRVSLSIGSDSSQVSSAIQGFVADYNTAIGLVNSSFAYNSATGSQGALGSDSTVRTLQTTMLAALNYTSGSGAIANLSALGISMNHDGTLAIDSTALNNAVTNNASDVQNFFQGAALNGFANSMSNQLGGFTQPATGAFTVDLKSIAAENTDLTKHINDFESIYIASQQTILTAMYSKAEIALQQLPAEMANIQAELGNNSKSGG